MTASRAIDEKGPPMSSADKKRARDRRAQQKRREKREAHVRKLEEELAFYRDQHRPQHYRQLEDTIDKLKKQNKALLERQQALLKLLVDWNADTMASTDLLRPEAYPVPAIARAAPRTSAETEAPESTLLVSPPVLSPGISHPTEEPPDQARTPEPLIALPPHGDTTVTQVSAQFVLNAVVALLQKHFDNIRSSLPARGDVPFDSCLGMDSPPTGSHSTEHPDRHRSIISPLTESLPERHSEDWSDSTVTTLDKNDHHRHPESGGLEISRRMSVSVPYWAQVPMSAANIQSESYCPWLSCPDIVSIMPDLPYPQDLLYGSTKNPVANSIYITLKDYSFGVMERLACGWLVYVYTKWRICPSEERYLNIPAFFRPTSLQLTQPHCPMFDNLVFPQLRDNLIKYFQDSNMDEIFSLFSTSVNIRYPKNLECLIPDDQNHLIFSPNFFMALTRLESWTLGREFALKYPHFAEGIPTVTSAPAVR
ncbi:uncharacterized protein Z518_04680 [Rhinocladiella mackenziei CBS 650.93]|uniref:BZIP domain-containing protein n=1 Tax=Rhinocladiella mackenziei CBS 650.93 TaxID=1442369 RepID=A0A0D2ILR1_9EURO|nr:uncharacterized protein Z518_04680 [Rhinocladiella mackenziei CBS 650.93]KIX06704.1 hypothetical protein Z518_04680 [Rhinocladiella mackenziei CBS 650.93]